MKKLVAHGLKGVKLVISDVHTGLKKAISTVLMEQQDEWLATEKRYMSLDSMAQLKALPLDDVASVALLTNTAP